MFRSTLVFIAVLLSGSAARAQEVEEVKASVLSIMPEDYDGERVQTQFSLLSVGSGKAKRIGCGKDDLFWHLGPSMEGGQMEMLKGTFILCVPKSEAKKIASASMGSTVTVQGTVAVKGPKAAPRIAFTESVIVDVRPLTVPSVPR